MAPYNPEEHHRRSLRLPNYDYTQSGAYFVTICTWNRECLLGEIVAGEMRLNEYGHIVVECWLAIPQHFPRVELDAFVVMPNHIHGIIMIAGATHPSPDLVGATHASPDPVGATHASPLQKQHRSGPNPQSLGAIVGSFKSAAAKRINEFRGTPGFPVWQRNYYEHIIRNESALQRIRMYIQNNPINWDLDSENPNRKGQSRC